MQKETLQSQRYIRVHKWKDKQNIPKENETTYDELSTKKLHHNLNFSLEQIIVNVFIFHIHCSWV